MVKKEGNIPANARVDVDYSKGKPKINFSFPRKNPIKDAINQHRVYPLLVLMILLWAIPYFALVYLVDEGNYKEYPEECNVSLNEGYANITTIIDGFEDGKKVNETINVHKKFVKGLNLSCDNGNYTLDYQREYSLIEKDTSFYPKSETDYKKFLLILIYFMIIAPLLIWILSGLITKRLLKSKKYCKWFPKAQANGMIFKTNSKKYKKFTSKDLIENIVVIPRFSNVELDYKTKGDFSKYLDKIKIREYRGRKINLKTNKKSKEKIEHYKWYAVFIFKEKPKSGYLEVIYQ